MARAYSQDLRDRVIDTALGGLPARRGCGTVSDRAGDGDPLGSPGAPNWRSNSWLSPDVGSGTREQNRSTLEGRFGHRNPSLVTEQ